MLVPSLVMVTVAPGSADCEVSATVPEIRPVVDIWAIAEIGIATHKKMPSVQSRALRHFKAVLQLIFLLQGRGCGRVLTGAAFHNMRRRLAMSSSGGNVTYRISNFDVKQICDF